MADLRTVSISHRDRQGPLNPKTILWLTQNYIMADADGDEPRMVAGSNPSSHISYINMILYDSGTGTPLRLCPRPCVIKNPPVRVSVLVMCVTRRDQRAGLPAAVSTSQTQKAPVAITEA